MRVDLGECVHGIGGDADRRGHLADVRKVFGRDVSAEAVPRLPMPPLNGVSGRITANSFPAITRWKNPFPGMLRRIVSQSS